MYLLIMNKISYILVQPKDLNFIAVNEEGDILEIPNGDEQAKFKLMSFFKSIHEINKSVALFVSFSLTTF